MKKLVILILLVGVFGLLSAVFTVSYLYVKAPVDMLKDLYPVVNVINPKGDFKIVFRHNKPFSWAKLEDISPLAVASIVVSEDWAFYDHGGVDYNQLFKAVRDHLTTKKGLRGASTISQQLVKNIFFDHSRSFKRKFMELIYTIKLERTFTKKQILEIYLNIVEFDKNIFGIQPASFHYFGKYPKYLTGREGAFLAMVLPSPKKYSVSFKEQKLTPFAKEVIDSILIKLRQAKYINEEQRKEEAAKKYVWESATVDDEDTHTLQQSPHLIDSEI